MISRDEFVSARSLCKPKMLTLINMCMVWGVLWTDTQNGVQLVIYVWLGSEVHRDEMHSSVTSGLPVFTEKNHFLDMRYVSICQ